MNWTHPAMATALLLCACAAPKRTAAPERTAPPERTATPRTTGTPAGARSLPPAGAKDGGHVAACRDGNCEVSVRSGTTIPLSPRFGIGPLAVTVDGEDVSLRAHTSETDTSNTVTAPATITLNDLTVNVLNTHDDTATLRISHR